jgi:hypothetical protein
MRVRRLGDLHRRESGSGFSAGVLAKDKLPEVSPEGLQLQKSKDARAVYLKPGATPVS